MAVLQSGPRSLALNTVAQVGGRLLLSVSRLVVAVMIVRLFGSDSFGMYAVLLGFIAIFEWLADFGQTDITVRNMCAEPEAAGPSISYLRHLKRLSAPLLSLLMPLSVLVFGYGTAISEAALAAAPGIAAYALLQPARARLKAGMRQDLDVLSELVGVIVLLGGTAFVSIGGGGLIALALCYAGSRIVQSALAIWWGGERNRAPAPAPDGERATISRGSISLLKEATPLGLAGLMVAIYEGMAPILLAKLTSFEEVAFYSVAARFAMPVLTILQALNSAFFPALARLRDDPKGLGELQDVVVWLTLLLAGGLAIGFAGGSVFLLNLFGDDMNRATGVLRAMCILVFARGCTIAMSPLIVIGGAQRIGMWLTAASLVLQAIAIMALVPRFGAIGIVYGYLAIECLLGIVPVTLLGLKATGAFLDPGIVFRFVLAAAGAFVASSRIPFSGNFLGGLMAGGLFLLLAAALGAFAPSRVRRVGAALKKRGSSE